MWKDVSNILRQFARLSLSTSKWTGRDTGRTLKAFNSGNNYRLYSVTVVVPHGYREDDELGVALPWHLNHLNSCTLNAFMPLAPVCGGEAWSAVESVTVNVSWWTGSKCTE